MEGSFLASSKLVLGSKSNTHYARFLKRYKICIRLQHYNLVNSVSANFAVKRRFAVLCFLPQLFSHAHLAEIHELLRTIMFQNVELYAFGQKTFFAECL